MILKPPLFAKPARGHPLGPYEGLWPMNEGRYNSTFNKVFDLSGNKNTGTFSGTGSWTPGAFGSSTLFAAGSPHISFDSEVIGAGAMTFWMWIYPTGSNSSSPRFADNGKFVFYFLSTGNILNFTSDGFGMMATGGVILLNTLQMIAVTRTATGVANIYLDGVLSGAANQASGTPVAGVGNLRFGQVYNATNRDYIGRIECAGLANRVYASSEIVELYLNPFIMFEQDPIELWVGATSVGVPPVGMAGAMTTNTGYWGW